MRPVSLVGHADDVGTPCWTRRHVSSQIHRISRLAGAVACSKFHIRPYLLSHLLNVAAESCLHQGGGSYADQREAPRFVHKYCVLRRECICCDDKTIIVPRRANVIRIGTWTMTNEAITILTIASLIVFASEPFLQDCVDQVSTSTNNFAQIDPRS